MIKKVYNDKRNFPFLPYDLNEEIIKLKLTRRELITILEAFEDWEKCTCWRRNKHHIPGTPDYSPECMRRLEILCGIKKGLERKLTKKAFHCKYCHENYGVCRCAKRMKNMKVRRGISSLK